MMQVPQGPSPHTALKHQRAAALHSCAQRWVAELLGTVEPRELADPVLL